MKPLLRVALWQCAPRPLDAAANLARLDGQAAVARTGGADLLVCPEMFTTGYAIGAEATHRLAEAADGPTAQAVARIARRHGIAIAWGYPERVKSDAADGAVYNAARLVGADGRALGGCRKTHLFGAADRAAFTPGAGDEALAELHGWRVGLCICYDIEFPETARRLALAGADVLLVPTANMLAFDVVSMLLLPARAVESQVFVAYANYCGREGEVVYGGLSGVLAPDGETPLRAGRDEALLFADLDGARLAASRRTFPYLQDRRADL